MKKKAVFTRSIQMMIWMLVMISVIGFLLGQWLMRFYLDREQEAIRGNIHRFIELNDNKYRQLNQELLYIAANDSNVKAIAAMAENENPDYRELLNYNINLSQIKSRLQNVVSVYGSEYYVWLYESRSKTFIDCGVGDFAEKTEFRELIGQQTREAAIPLSQNGKWFIMDGKYICTSLRFANVYIGTKVETDAYLNSIMKMKMTPCYLAGILDEDGRVVCAKRYDRGLITNIENMDEDDMSYQLTIREQGEKSNFSIVFRLQQKWYENANILQMAVITVSLMILSVIILYSVYLRKKVLRPILNFYHEITSYTGLARISVTEDVAELDSVAGMLNNLLDEVHKLGLDNYEQKTKRQEAELGFAQQQIRPHFFINCLNVIYGMAQLNQKENIQELCVDISDYMRILFAENKDQVLLLQELDMIDKYMSVMGKVQGQKLTYVLQKKCGLQGVVIPPLLIQTFVENSVKHGQQEEEIRICVSIDCDEQERMLTVEIQDSGAGFSDEVLRKLKCGEPLHKRVGYQIGISNVIQRLKLLYGENWELLFCNNSQGANVRIRIPDGGIPGSG